MKKYIFLLLMLLTTSVFSQETTREQSEKALAELDRMKDSDSECGPHKKLSLKQRISFYPFNVARKIMLISFDLFGEYGNQVPIENKIIIEKLIKNKTTLSFEKVDKLTNLLYNIGYKNSKAKFHLISKGTCYEPRNAIVFLDQNNKVIDYIGICFSCETHIFSSDKIKDFNYCTNKYTLLANFFSLNGVKYGTRSGGY